MQEDKISNDLLILDRETLSSRLMNDDALIVEILNIFLQDAPVLLKSMQDAIRVSDISKLRDSAHSLKGSAGNIGADRVRCIAKKLEDSARDNQMEFVPTILLELEENLKILYIEIQKIISEKQK